MTIHKQLKTQYKQYKPSSNVVFAKTTQDGSSSAHWGTANTLFKKEAPFVREENRQDV